MQFYQEFPKTYVLASILQIVCSRKYLAQRLVKWIVIYTFNRLLCRMTQSFICLCGKILKIDFLKYRCVCYLNLKRGYGGYLQTHTYACVLWRIWEKLMAVVVSGRCEQETEKKKCFSLNTLLHHELFLPSTIDPQTTQI